MRSPLYISAYTPSNTAPETLEKMFVQRHRLLEKTVVWCEESITTSKKNHLLFVGPRGSGKTHFISMLVNRLRAKPALHEKMIILWLGEDEVITSLVDLLLLMIESLVKTDPERFDKDCLKQAIGQKPDTVADIIMHSIVEQIGSHTIFLFKENLGDVFSGLKDAGQKKLRAYLQENNNIVMLATSHQLFSGVSSRDAAFFGFFDTYHLRSLSVEDAKQLISNIASLNNNQQLVDFLKTPQGCYRVRALHHLGGGNHRLYVDLSDFLTMEALDDFVFVLSKLADKLVPYFQERIKSLPAQQGRIIQKLCEMQGAIPVKKIAEESFIGERSVAKQLGDLAKKGLVISHKRGKQSYYEIAEPLMRLVLEFKSSQGKSIKNVASLLRAWFAGEGGLSAKEGEISQLPGSNNWLSLSLSMEDAYQLIEEALKEGRGNVFDPLKTQNILLLIARLGASFWEKYIDGMVRLYAQYGGLSCLGSGVIRSISFFVEDESLTSLFGKWQQLWLQHAEMHQEMQIPLQVLQAAVLAIEQKNDKPLFSLPKEVRELVLPLLAGRLN